MNPTELCYQPAGEMAPAIRSRETSSEECVRAHLDRIVLLNPVLNAVARLAPDSAIAQAREADSAIARGDVRGPLHGVPFTVKDVYAVVDAADLSPAPGMPTWPHDPARRQSPVVTRMRDSGAVLIGMTRATL